MQASSYAHTHTHTHNDKCDKLKRNSESSDAEQRKTKIKNKKTIFLLLLFICNYHSYYSCHYRYYHRYASLQRWFCGGRSLGQSLFLSFFLYCWLAALPHNFTFSRNFKRQLAIAMKLYELAKFIIKQLLILKRNIAASITIAT